MVWLHHARRRAVVLSLQLYSHSAWKYHRIRLYLGLLVARNCRSLLPFELPLRTQAAQLILILKRCCGLCILMQYARYDHWSYFRIA